MVFNRKRLFFRWERVPGVLPFFTHRHGLMVWTQGTIAVSSCLNEEMLIRIPRKRKPTRNALHLPLLLFAFGLENNFADNISYGHLLLWFRLKKALLLKK